MPALQPIEQFDFGGVDSRSNALNMPVNRALYMRNWAPRPDGHLELRYGYSTVTMSAVSAVAIHSLIPYQSWDTTKKYLLFFQGTAVKVLDLSSTTVSSPAVSGAAISSSAKWGYCQSNNRIHLGNGTDQKFYDGVKLRDSGLRAPTASEVRDVIVVPTVRELSSAEIAAVTLTENAGGNFTASIENAGYLVYVSFFNISDNSIGPATIAVATRKVITGATGRQIDVAVMPASAATLPKLISRTKDGGTDAYFQYDTDTVITSCTRASLVLTVVSTAHGLSSNQVAILTGTTNFDGIYAVTVLDANTVTVGLVAEAGANVTGGNTTGGKLRRILQATGAGTTASITDINKISTDYVANQDLGLAAAAAESAAGYQFFIALYNSITGHVGNRISVGPRFNQAFRSNALIAGLPSFAGIDAEWLMLVGRTGDGASVPYACIDNGGNFITVPSGQTAIIVSAAEIDGDFELPTRNGIIPSQCTMFARVGTRCYAADPNSPTVRASGDEADFTQGKFLGRPEQSWAANDIDTFPTAEPISGIAEVDYELFVGSKNDTAVFTDMNGQFVWRGPWNVGLAGSRAMSKAMPYGFFWVSGDKQLCTFQAGVPAPVSDEYEQAELSRIGDAHIGEVEVRYFRDVHTNKDELRIECRDSTGNPFTVIHDFKLRDLRSTVGQGYSAVFAGPLGTFFPSVEGRDANGRRQIFAGASTGRIYQLYALTDDAGNSFSADGIFLIDAGTKRLDVPNFDWFGDQNVDVSLGRTLASTFGAGADAFVELGPESAVQEEEKDPRWRVDNPKPEVKSHLYLRLQLDSHAADGDLSFNSPPHIPLETYGRIYEVVPMLGSGRDL